MYGVRSSAVDFKSIKAYCILGFGRTGVATARLLLDKCPDAQIRVSEFKARDEFDQNLIESLEGQGVEFEFGKQTEDFVLNKGAFVIISPGIAPRTPIVQDVFASKSKHGTDLDLFAYFLKPEQNYVAITGTNGKTTTTSILSHIFNSPALGNIGKPFLEFEDNYFPYFACEVSSFQSYYSKYFRDFKIPKVSVFLNFSADHLDWHKDLKEYQNSKEKLFLQSLTESNFWVLNFDDPHIKHFGIKTRMLEGSGTSMCYFSSQDISYTLSRKYPLVGYQKEGRLYLARYLEDTDVGDQLGTVMVNANNEYYLEIPLCETKALNIVGDHNYSNALAAALSAYLLDFSPEFISDSLVSFKPVEHRLEFVRDINNNKIYNDSKSTNPDSTQKALDSFDESIVIVGGKDKNLDLDPFIRNLFKKAYAVIAIGETQTAIYDGLRRHGFDKIRRAATLEEAFSIAVMYGDDNNFPIVLSPGSSSFDMFEGYEDRGNQFKEIVLNY